MLTEVVDQNCLDMAENNKVRCAVTTCKKLFKGKEFLMKHIPNKHPELTFERLVRITEPYMLSRFEAKDINARLLPPLEVETDNGRIEEKSVNEMRDIALNKVPIQNTRRGEKRRYSNEFSDDRRDYRDFGGGFRDQRDYGDQRGMNRPPPPPFKPPPPVIVAEDPNARTLNAYRDVDAPVAVSCVDSDFGVSLPPPKK